MKAIKNFTDGLYQPQHLIVQDLRHEDGAELLGMAREVIVDAKIAYKTIK